MDCPNCGVYNPEDRQVCWRCDHELPSPEKPKKPRDPAQAMRRMWIILIVILVIWVVVTWFLPRLMGGG